MALLFGDDDHRPVLMRELDAIGSLGLVPPPLRSGVLRVSPYGHSTGLSPSLLVREAGFPGHSPLAAWAHGKLLKLSGRLLRTMFPRAAAGPADAFAEAMNLLLPRYGIDSICRIACFLGQTGVESQGFTRFTENLNYRSTEALKKAFGNRLDDEELPDFLQAPEALANRVYASRYGNGDEASGDGWRYRGRGLIQLTFRDNYEAFFKATGVDVADDLDRLAQPTLATHSAGWYWHSRGCNGLADSGEFIALTRRINAARLHEAERRALTERCADALRRELLHPGGS